jgi:hypothetical protein
MARESGEIEIEIEIEIDIEIEIAISDLCVGHGAGERCSCTRYHLMIT